MTCTSFRETAPAISAGNVTRLAPHQRKARRQRRWAWWRALLFGFGPAKNAHVMPITSSRAAVKFRRQAGASHW
jgi:hypothetical protein